MDDEFIERIMYTLHQCCFDCPLRESCIEMECPVFRIEKILIEEIEGIRKYD